MSRQLRREDYTVGWVCALPVELAAAQEMLDEEHLNPNPDPGLIENDKNLYAVGSIGGHNVAIVCLPAGRIGNNPAAVVATQLQATFKAIRFGLMVGIGGGVPSAENDIRLGDVVVSQPHQAFGGVVQYDVGKTTPSGFTRAGSLNSPPQVLLSAVARVRANELRDRSNLSKHALQFEHIVKFRRVKAGPDNLFKAAYDHASGQTCDGCSADQRVIRQPRESVEEVVIHCGTIASGNRVIKDARTRDKLSAELGGVLCFEMEAAGMMNTFPCLVIRGICDYADSHKNKQWQPYAAARAAACAKELLLVIPAVEVAKIRTAEEATRVSCKHDSPRPRSPTAKHRRADSSERIEVDIPHQPNVIIASRSQIKRINRAQAQLSPEQQNCLRSLAFPEQEHRLHDVLVARDTCEWLLEDTHYQTWMNKAQGFFWVKGNPGAGKSVLMKHAFKNMREHRPKDLVIAFFFHGQGTDLQKTSLGLFRALLSVSLQHFPEYLARLTTTFQEREELHGAYTEDRWKWSEKELEHVLYDILTQGTQYQPVVIFVDALDECGESSAKSLLAYFKQVTARAERANGQIKICLSSRHYPILGFEIVSTVHVEERNDKDIQWYAQERLRDTELELKREQIETEILARAGGGFQWVYLVTETIINKKMRGIKTETLLRELTSCPETLSELYASILRDVPTFEQRQMVKIFQWVLYAQRPLSAQELRDALATDKDMSCTSVRELRAYEGWSDTLKNFERYVKDISRGLIHFQSRDIWEQYIPHGEDSDREAKLIHQSVADYLLDKVLNESECHQDVHPSPRGAAHIQISRSCLRYLTLKEILEEAKPSRGTLSSMFPLAPYAVRFVFDHIQCVEKEGISQSDLLPTLQWKPKSEHMRKLGIAWRTLDPHRAHTPLGWPFVEATSMHVLVTFGSRSAVDFYLETDGNEVDGRDTEGNTPLMLAIREGHQDVALTLLNWSAGIEHQQNKDNDQFHSRRRSTGYSASHVVDINATNVDGDSVLDIALDERAEDVLVKLIEAGADLKYTGRESALVFLAISSKNLKLLSICIEKKFTLDGSIVFALRDRLPQQDHVFDYIISELLKAGANTTRAAEFEGGLEPEVYDERESNDGERYNDDALMIASRRGLASVVHLLLAHGSSATSQNEIGDTPLLVAIENNHVEIVQSLLQKEPSSVCIANDEGRTALEIAVENGHEALVKLLLDTGKVDVNAATPGGSTPLLLAAQYGYEVVVKLMLDTSKADINTKSTDGWSPLLWAARNGHKAVVEVLLSTRKADINARTPGGWSPLLWAARNGNEAVVKVLLDPGKVDINAKTTNGWSSLLWAAENGHQTVVKVLFDTGKVDINAKTADGWSPLLLAARNGHEAVVKVLLDTGKVDIYATTPADGWTSLLLAARNGHEAVVKVLLDTSKVNVNAATPDGSTPLLYAVEKGHEAVVKLLLDTGKVNVNATTPTDGWPPLLLAARNRHEAVVKLLLDTGKVDVNATTPAGGWSPLLWAAAIGHDAVVKLLLSTSKVNVNATTPANGRSPLLWAARNGHEAVVKLLLNTGKVDVNATTPADSWSLLIWAARNGQEAVVKLLLDTSKVDFNATTPDGWSPLLWAAAMGHDAVVKLLLDTGEVNVNTTTPADGWSPLLWAARNGHEAVVKLLLDTSKVDFNTTTPDGWSPLLLAARKGHEAVVKLLLNTGKVNVNATTPANGWSPLLWAALNGEIAVAKLLLDTGKVDINAKTPDGWSLLLWAARSGHEAVVKLLLDTGEVNVNATTPADGWSPLLWAARNGHEAVVKLLLDTGKVDVNTATPGGSTPLSCAAEKGHEAIVKLLLDTSRINVYATTPANGWSPLLWAALNGEIAVVKLLLDASKVDINAKTTDGWSPLLWAAATGNEAVVKLLLDTGKVDVNAATSNGFTPLLLAARYEHEALVKLLLNTGKVDINAKTVDGWSSLLWAAYNGKTAVAKLLLITDKVDVNAATPDRSTPLLWAVERGHEAVVKLLLDTGKVDVNAKTTGGWSPLLWAAATGHEAVVKLLLDTGKVDINATTSANSWSPLLRAPYNGQTTAATLLLDTSKVDIDVKTTDGWSPLLLAVRNGHEGVVELLLNTGKVDTNAKTTDGWSPLSLAADTSHKAVLGLLRMQSLPLASS